MKRGLLAALAAIMFITGVVLIARSWPSSHPQPAATQPELEPETAERAESPLPTPSKKAIKVAGSVPVKLRFPSIKDGGKVVTVRVASVPWADPSQPGLPGPVMVVVFGAMLIAAPEVGGHGDGAHPVRGVRGSVAVRSTRVVSDASCD